MAEGIFERLYGASEEVLKAAKKPIIRKKYKRAYVVFVEDTMQRVLLSNDIIEKEREKFDNCNLNLVAENLLKIEKARKIIELMKSDYLAVFGEEMKVDEE